MIQLQSYVLDGWSNGQAPFRDLPNPATDEVVAQASTNGLDMGAVMAHARSIGGPTLRAMSFEERGAMLRTWSKALYAAREALLDVTMVNAGSAFRWRTLGRGSPVQGRGISNVRVRLASGTNHSIAGPRLARYSPP